MTFWTDLVSVEPADGTAIAFLLPLFEILCKVVLFLPSGRLHMRVLSLKWSQPLPRIIDLFHLPA